MRGLGRLSPLLAAFVATTLAAKDSNYYPQGYSNPNIQYSMYWRDAPNILADLENFDKLYVTFENCAWSPYETGDSNPCGVAQNDDTGAYWYMGYTECFRANAAFSLYGILKGHADLGCQKTTFINSFFTLNGVETFTRAVANTGFAFTSTSSNGNSENANAPAVVTSCYTQNDYQGNGNSIKAASSGKVYGNSLSYGLGCINKDFARWKYRGAYCDANSALIVVDKLTAFNKDMQKLSCIEIYNATAAAEAADDDGAAGNQGQYRSNQNQLSLLSSSRACSVQDYPNQCPDPYGKLHHYASASARATTQSMHPKKERVKRIVSWVLFLLGSIFIIIWLFYFRIVGHTSRIQKVAKTVDERPKRKSHSAHSESRMANGDESSQRSNSNRGNFWKRFRGMFGRKHQNNNQRQQAGK